MESISVAYEIVGVLVNMVDIVGYMSVALQVAQSRSAMIERHVLCICVPNCVARRLRYTMNIVGGIYVALRIAQSLLLMISKRAKSIYAVNRIASGQGGRLADAVGITSVAFLNAGRLSPVILSHASGICVSIPVAQGFANQLVCWLVELLGMDSVICIWVSVL